MKNYIHDVPQTGDIVLFRKTKHITPIIISAVEYRIGFTKQEADFTHVGVMLDKLMVLESRVHGVEVNPLAKYDKGSYIILRKGGIDKEQFLLACSHVYYSGKGKTFRRHAYDVTLLLAIYLASWGFSKKPVKRLLRNGKYICSEAVLKIFELAGSPIASGYKALYPANFKRLHNNGKLIQVIT